MFRGRTEQNVSHGHDGQDEWRQAGSRAGKAELVNDDEEIGDPPRRRGSRGGTAGGCLRDAAADARHAA
jgi:hypothetical protein